MRPMAATELKIVRNATCTFCGCVCDDIELHAEGERITKTKNACVLGEAWFLNHTPRTGPDALIDGKPATVDDGDRGGRRHPRRRPHPAGLRPDATSPARRSARRCPSPS